LPVNPKKNRFVASIQAVEESPIPIIGAGSVKAATSNILRLPYFVTRYPDMGNPVNDPIGKSSSTEPKAALFKCKRS